MRIIRNLLISAREVWLLLADAIEEQNATTLEISRTVAETSLAAREVATQIASVSREAVETGRRASEIRDGSIDIGRKVDDPRTTLVRVIRTSTSDVDRRLASQQLISTAAQRCLSAAEFTTSRSGISRMAARGSTTSARPGRSIRGFGLGSRAPRSICPARLVAHDIGNMVAYALAARHRDRVTKARPDGCAGAGAPGTKS